MMVPEVASTSVVLVVFVLIVFLLFIWKLKVNIVREVHSYVPEKYRMLSTSQRRIPFSIEINKNSKQDILEFTLSSIRDFKAIFYCAVASDELKKQIGQREQRTPERSLLETINLISSWNSDEFKIHVSEKQKHVRTFDFRTLPHDQQQIIADIKQEISRLAPFAVYLQVENIDGLLDNDIVSMVIVFSWGGRMGFQIREYFIETLSGTIYPLTKLYHAGTERNEEEEEGNVTPNNDSSTTSIHQQNCIVCQSYPVTRAILPCRHACVCKLCYFKLPHDLCPICRQPISSYFVVRDESFLPVAEEEERDDVNADIRRMGWWKFIKAVWNSG